MRESVLDALSRYFDHVAEEKKVNISEGADTSDITQAVEMDQIFVNEG